jgi:Transcriptional regulator, AbiEi antitoxin
MSDKIPADLRDQASWQAGVITREQALRAGLSRNAIVSRLRHGRWLQVYRGVYATFSGPIGRDAELWGVVLYTGSGARLSHETAAELIHLRDRPSPLIHVTIAAKRRVVAPTGVAIHRSVSPETSWRFARGIPPHTFAEETVIDLVHAAANLDEVIGYVTGAFARNLTSAERLGREAAERKRLRWRADLDEIIPKAAGGAHSVLEYRYDRDVGEAHGLPGAKKQVAFTKPDGSRGRRDRCYEEYDLIIELDGRQFHPDELRSLDQARDNDATATGGSTLRYGWYDVTRRPCVAAAQVHAALTKRGYTGALKPCSPTCGALSPGSRVVIRAGGSCRA